jgi:hypothetical protein
MKTGEFFGICWDKRAFYAQAGRIHIVHRERCEYAQAQKTPGYP